MWFLISSITKPLVLMEPQWKYFNHARISCRMIATHRLRPTRQIACYPFLLHLLSSNSFSRLTIEFFLRIEGQSCFSLLHRKSQPRSQLTIIPTVIDSQQAKFINDHSIQNNFLAYKFAKKLVHQTNQLEIFLKLDVVKAYDCLYTCFCLIP